MKVKTSKGFTLAELLIVMAIIVVLAAIAIPTFGKQLETAREASDVEALRTALTDAFTQAYVDYANDVAWTNAETPSGGKVQGVDVSANQGAYIVDFTDIAPMIQTVAGFDYVTPKFRVGANANSIPLTETASVGASGTDIADAIVFVFSPGATGSESEIQLVNAVTVKKST